MKFLTPTFLFTIWYFMYFIYLLYVLLLVLYVQVLYASVIIGVLRGVSSLLGDFRPNFLSRQKWSPK